MALLGAELHVLHQRYEAMVGAAEQMAVPQGDVIIRDPDDPECAPWTFGHLPVGRTGGYDA
jgi:hypothetical protein